MKNEASAYQNRHDFRIRGEDFRGRGLALQRASTRERGVLQVRRQDERLACGAGQEVAAPLGLDFEFPEEGLWLLGNEANHLARSIGQEIYTCAFRTEGDAFYFRDVSAKEFPNHVIVNDFDPIEVNLERLRCLAIKNRTDGIGLFKAPSTLPFKILYVKAEGE